MPVAISVGEMPSPLRSFVGERKRRLLGYGSFVRCGGCSFSVCGTRVRLGGGGWCSPSFIRWVLLPPRSGESLEDMLQLFIC